MSYDCLLDTLRRSATDASATRPQLFRPPTMPSPIMECQYVAITNHDEFYRLLRLHGEAGRIMGPVLYCRLYQRRANHSPEYDVWFLAVMPLEHSRNELRVRCGSQDFGQDSDSHPASRQALRLQQELATHCTLLGLEVREADYGEMF